MGEIAAPVIRSTVTDDEFGGFRITIPGSDGARLAFGIGFAVWGFVLALTLWSFVTSQKRITFEEIKFYGGWTAIGVFMGLFALSKGIAREVIIIEGKSLVLRKEFTVFSKARTFELAQVRNLRPMRSQDEYNTGRRPDMVAFDHNRRTYRFGHGLSEQEFMRLIKTIRSRFPIRDDWNDVEPLPVVR
jgi:hypothetical protein